MAFGKLAMVLILEGVTGRLLNVRNGRYDHVPIDVVTSRKKVVDVGKFYNTERLRPQYKRFAGSPVFIMTSDY
jgi:6-phosphofructokinase 1